MRCLCVLHFNVNQATNDRNVFGHFSWLWYVGRSFDSTDLTLIRNLTRLFKQVTTAYCILILLRKLCLYGHKYLGKSSEDGETYSWRWCWQWKYLMSCIIYREAVIYSVGDSRFPLLSSWKPWAPPPPQNFPTFPSSLLPPPFRAINKYQWLVRYG